MMKIQLGYPNEEAERALLSGGNPRDSMHRLKPVVSVERFIEIQTTIDDVHCSDPLLRYVQQLVHTKQLCSLHHQSFWDLHQGWGCGGAPPPPAKWTTYCLRA